MSGVFKVRRFTLPALLACAALVLSAAPAGGASSGFREDNVSGYGVTQFFRVNYNYQTCSDPGNPTAYKITGVAFHYTRIDTDHILGAYPSGQAGAGANRCGGGRNAPIKTFTLSDQNICFGCSGDPLRTPNGQRTWSDMPYVYPWFSLDSAGAWLKSTVKRRSNGVTLGQLCSAPEIFGDVICSPW